MSTGTFQRTENLDSTTTRFDKYHLSMFKELFCAAAVPFCTNEAFLHVVTMLGLVFYGWLLLYGNQDVCMLFHLLLFLGSPSFCCADIFMWLFAFAGMDEQIMWVSLYFIF